MMEKKYNIGWALLKLWMCWEVVLVHSWTVGVPAGKPMTPMLDFVASVRPYCVPVFMLITFILAAPKFAACDGTWLKKRLIRLLTPYVFWSLLTFAVWRLLGGLSDAFAAPLEYLGWQLLLGTTRQYGSQMWFQAVLVILTVFFALFFRCVRSRYVVAGLVAVLVASVALDYTGLNRWLFEGFRYEVCNPLGRIFPMMLYGSAGLLIGLNLKRLALTSFVSRAFVAALSLGVFLLLTHFEVFVKPTGFYYCGLKMFFVALAMVAFFNAISFDALPERGRKAIVWCSRFSMGVYFVHIFVGRLLETLAFPAVGVVPRSFTGACVVFFVSFALCVLISLIPARFARMLVE